MDTVDTVDTPPDGVTTPVKGWLAYNEDGRVIGESHQWAVLTDAQVDAIRDAYEAGQDGTGPRVGYRALAKQYNVGKRTIRDIVNYKRRNQWAAKWKRRRGQLNG